MYEHSEKINAHVCNRVEATYGMNVRRSDPPCIWRHNKEHLICNDTLVLRSFTPDFSDNITDNFLVLLT